jgi:hypothetical protein
MNKKKINKKGITVGMWEIIIGFILLALLVIFVANQINHPETSIFTKIGQFFGG